MISKLDAIQFYGIKTLLEGKEQANLQELEFRILKVIRSLQGGVRTEGGGNKRNALELSRAKELIDELLSFHGLGDGSGEHLFDKLISDEKARRKREKAQKSKSHKKSSGELRKGSKKAPKQRKSKK